MNDPLRTKLERTVEQCEVSGVPVDLIWTTDEYHEYGGDFTYGWKADIDGNQYGDFMGLFANQREEGKKTLLEQCAQTIEAIRGKMSDSTDATQRIRVKIYIGDQMKTMTAFDAHTVEETLESLRQVIDAFIIAHQKLRDK